MNTTPIMYNDKQFEELESYVEENFGSGYDYIVHELTSEYVHTDVFLVKASDGSKVFVTCGMGAATMEAVTGNKRCELVMAASPTFVSTKDEGAVLSAELIKISKYPFRESTWIGTGHTINLSKRFKESFGYDYFAFARLPLSTKLPGFDEEVEFLLAVPIFESEREWCVKNSTLGLLERLHEKYGGKELYADFKREPLIPNDLDQDEIDDYHIMTVLGIGRAAMEKVCEHLAECEEKGIEVDLPELQEWIKDNI